MDSNKRVKMSRESLLKDMGLSEEEYTANGATFEELEPIFNKYNIKYRVYDTYHKLICENIPDHRNSRAALFCVMITDNHVYVLNDDLKVLLRTEEKEDFLKATSDFHIKPGTEERETRVSKMIEDVDDLIKITRDSEIINNDESVVYHVILRKNNLNETLFKLMGECGYTPTISHVSGKIMSMVLSINKTKFIIKTQQLITNGLDGEIEVDNVET